MAARVLFLAGKTRHPGAATRRIEFHEKDGTIQETITFLNGKTVVESKVDGYTSAEFSQKLQSSRYPLGNLRQHMVDGHRVLFVEDLRPVRLTTDEAIAA